MLDLGLRRSFQGKGKIMTAKVLESAARRRERTGALSGSVWEQTFRPSAAAAPVLGVLQVGTITAPVNQNLRIARTGRSFMLEVCDQCGSLVSKKLLRCNDETAVFHRECANGHKRHRTMPNEEANRTEPSAPSTSFVMIEACDCGQASPCS
jgi:hypothetical protein